MRMFSEEVKHTFSNSPLNILQVADFSEIFFGVYEVEINKRKYPVEKISEHNGNPVVSVPVEIKGKKANYPFVLTKGNPEIIFNENSDYVEIFENSQNNQNIEEEIIQIEEDVEEIEIPNLENKKQKILEEIQKAKKKALIASKKEIERQKSQKIKQIREEKDLKEKALKNYLESARENLVGEFTNISQKIKNELISENDGRFSEIKDTIDNKIQDLADSLNESLKKDFNNSSKLIDKSIKQLVKDLYENNINPRVDKELNNIAVEIVEKVSEIDKNLNSKLDKKADISLIEGVEKELDSIRDSNIELNNSLNKGIQKALSRVGNVDKKIIDVSEKFERRVEKTEKDITSYFDKKINLLKEETLDITDEARLYFQNLIQESKNGLLSEIRKIKNEKPVEYILETKNGKSEVKDWDSIEKDWNKKIHDKIENVRTDLRKYVAVYASGGGTNAKQYANGGTMNGSLNVIGQILSGGVDLDDIFATKLQLLDYLPLSGGTMTGDINFDSAGITNVDSITFNTALETVPNTGEIGWNNADGTLDVGLNNNVIVPVGEKEVVYVKAAEDIKNGQCVYASDASGGGSGNIIVSLFNAAGIVDELRFLGIATQDINTNEFGYVATFGKIKNVLVANTRGTDDPDSALPANQGWTIGTILYVSATSPGKYTSVPPTPPNKRMPIALVIAENGNSRIIFARAEHGYDLNELHNVNIVNPQNNQILTYNKTLSTWNNTSNLNVTSLSATSLSATTIHALSSFVEVIDIKQYELSGFNVKGDATVQGSISATGNLVVDTDTLYVDSVNDRVGIGTTNPTSDFHVVGSSYFSGSVSTTSNLLVGGPVIYLNTQQALTVGVSNLTLGNAAAWQTITYGHSTAISHNFISGNVGIGTTTPNEKLTVSGNISASGDLIVDTDTLYVDSVNDRVGIGTSNPLFPLDVVQSGTAAALRVSGGTNPQIRVGNTITAKLQTVDGSGFASFGTENNYNFRIITNNIERITVGTTGNVGIGTTTPNEKLTVSGNISASGDLIVDTDTLYVDSVNDRVGIGTVSPSSPLHVLGSLRVDNGSTAGALNFGADVNDTIRTSNKRKLATIVSPDYANTRNIEWLSSDSGSSSTNSVYVGGRVGGTNYGATQLILATTPNNTTTGGIAALVITPSQNVGIGITSPSYKLDVNGDANISTSLTVGTSLDVGGHFSAATKSFLINHPTKPGKKLQYGVVESNQHSVFVRGTSTQDTIVLPEEWEGLVHEDSVTVQLTPVGSYQPLYVVSQNSKQVVVGGTTGKYNYTIYGERKDVAKLETEV